MGTKVVQFSDGESVHKSRILVGVSVEVTHNENRETRLGTHLLDDGSEDSLPRFRLEPEIATLATNTH